MANTFAPNGFTGVRRLDGAAWTAAQNPVLIAAANTHQIFIGDPVVRLSTGYIDRVAIGSIPTQGTLGIFVGCSFVPGGSGSPFGWYNPPSGGYAADTTAYIIDDPNVVFRCWVGTGASSAAGGPATIANVSENFQWQVGTGNTSSGISGAYLDFTTNAGTTNTLPLTMIGTVTNPPGVNGTDITTAGNLVEVILNQQAYKVGTTGVA